MKSLLPALLFCVLLSSSLMAQQSDELAMVEINESISSDEFTVKSTKNTTAKRAKKSNSKAVPQKASGKNNQAIKSLNHRDLIDRHIRIVSRY